MGIQLRSTQSPCYELKSSSSQEQLPQRVGPSPWQLFVPVKAMSVPQDRACSKGTTSLSFRDNRGAGTDGIFPRTSDSWQKREQASETKYIRDKEMEALRNLKKRLADQRAHLEELEKHINTLESERVDLDERSK